MSQALAIYLPMDRRHALATGTPLPEYAQGTALFADISGFTPLTEALTRELGVRRGAEELPRQLDLVYDALIGEVDHYGGSVIGFAGDAITCWFDQDSGLRATACGLAMQAAMRAFTSVPLPSGATTSLALKVAVAAGAARRFVVGDPHVQRIDVLAGSTLTRMAAAEHMAQKGELILDERTAAALREALDIQDWRTDTEGALFATVIGLRQDVAPQPWPPLSPDCLPPDTLRSWLLRGIHERLHVGQGEFLTELRPVVALFLRFGGLDYDADPAAGQKLDAYICWVQAVVARYEGTLLSLTMGDKGSYLYIAFGAPMVHEDDARRAALAALALRTPPEALTFIRPIQIGLSRGIMRTGAYGGTTRRTYGALGDEVNLAARLMQHARSGEIVASGRVQAATATLFYWQSLAEIQVKGKRDPVPIFALQDEAKTRLLALAEPSYPLPMIGREADLVLLQEKLALARRAQGQVVAITAEAGMGKSRLVAEVIRAAQRQDFTGYGGECQSYGTSTPYLVWQGIWRTFFGLEAAAPPATQAEQLERAIRELNPTLLPRLPLLGPILGLPLADNELTYSFTPELRKASREALLVELLQFHARRVGPVLLVLEDCHWLDAASHDLLEVIGRAIAQEAVLIVLAYRPLELERLAAPRVSTLPYFTQLSLAELGEPEMAQFIVQRLGYLYPPETRQPPAGLMAQLTARAQGNPFYLEELLNYLHDQGLDPYDAKMVAHLELPNTLHRLLLSRIDRLTEPQKLTLKVASIIGRLFRLTWLVGYYPALGEPMEVKNDLDILALLDLTPLEQAEPELVYLFKHIVTREVAYESLPYTTRARLHEALAAYLEQQDPLQVEKYLDLLAHHYALSENLAKKREYLRRAGEAAQAAYATEAALEYYERLLPLVTGLERSELLLRLGQVLKVPRRYDEALYCLQEALALRVAQGSTPSQVAEIEEAMSSVCQAASRWAETIEHCQRAISGTLDPLKRASHRVRLIRAYLTSKLDPDEAQAQLDMVFAEMEEFLPPWDQESEDITDERLQQLVYQEDHLDEHLSSQERERFRVLSLIYDVARYSAYLRNDHSLMLQLAIRELEMAQRVGPSNDLARAYRDLAIIMARQQRVDIAEHAAWKMVQIDEQMGDPQCIASSRRYHAMVKHLQGASREAETLQRRCLEQYGQWMDNTAFMDAVGDFAWNLLIRGYACEAWPWVERAILQRADTLRSNEVGHPYIWCFAVPTLAVLGRTRESRNYLQKIQAFLATAPTTHPLQGFFLGFLLFFYLEQEELGFPLEEAIQKFHDLGVSPRQTTFHRRHFYLCQAHIRLVQCLNANAATLTLHLAALRVALEELREIDGPAVLRCHTLVIEGAVLSLEGAHEEALARLEDAEAFARSEDSLWGLFEVWRNRARVFRRQGHDALVRREASSALTLALEQGWSNRSRWLQTEFHLI